ncbi:uncharacterized protein LOC135961510 [Calliphora vicina]|uniref:uncharacterized protein LOC135961510 n=1 Tax=Calliphora vicina TaxID=7373 RepID=UPI00325BBF06
MKCCNRSTLGVIIGSLNVLVYILGIISAIDVIVKINTMKELAILKILFIVLIVVFFIMILVSGLLITGIVKRRHKLMLPWLILSSIGIVGNCAWFGYHIIVALIQGIPPTTFIIGFLAGLVGIAFSALMLRLISVLYRDMRKENSQMSARVLNNSRETDSSQAAQIKITKKKTKTMKCCSLSTLGVIIGSLHVLFYIVSTYFASDAIVVINADMERNPGRQEEYEIYKTLLIIVIVVCLIMILISGLLITGIVNKRHKLMLPWLILSGIGFVINCARFGYDIIAVIFLDISLSTAAEILFKDLVGIAIFTFIMWAIYTLYRDIRKHKSLIIAV